MYCATTNEISYYYYCLFPYRDDSVKNDNKSKRILLSNIFGYMKKSLTMNYLKICVDSTFIKQDVTILNFIHFPLIFVSYYKCKVIKIKSRSF